MSTLDYILDKYKANQKIYLDSYSRWHSLTYLLKELDFKLGAEIGVGNGRFSEKLCRVNPQLKLYGIDAWKIYPRYKNIEPVRDIEETYEIAVKRLTPYKVEIIRDYSMDAVKRFADESLDFVYIDCNHEYDYVKEDIREWSKKVRKGGVVAGHDYCSGVHDDFLGQKTTYGVKQAVDEWVAQNKISPLFIFSKDLAPSWLYVKE
jgi:hypothetical protein